jgi:DNA-binding beta-propeller fold protein YncE
MRDRRNFALGCFGLVMAAGALVMAGAGDQRAVNGTIWVANRGAHTIRGFDAATGDLVNTIAMAANSQPGDLAYAKGKLYVAEEFGTPPAIAILDEETGNLITRIPFTTGWRPHHVHASSGGNLVAVGLYGTDMVAVIDTRDDTLLGPWDSNPQTTNGRVHAGVFDNDGNTLYLANEGGNELIAMDPLNGAVLWRLSVPGIHELAVTHNGKLAYVSQRSQNKLSVVDLETPKVLELPQPLTLGLPDTLQLSANEKLLTVGLRTSPARMAVVDTSTFEYELVTLSEPGQATTIAGHQWTSPSGRYTFASFEGGTSPGVAVIDHFEGNTVVQRLAYAGRPHGVDFAHP